MEREASPFLDFVEALFRNWVLVVALGVTILAVSTAMAILAKPEYGSEMQFLVQNSRAATVVGAESGSASTVLTPDALEQQVNSQVALLQAGDLMEDLVVYRDQVLAKGKAPASGSLLMAREKQNVEGSLLVTPVRKTNLISVNYSDADPVRAQNTLRYLSGRFLEKQAELRRPAGTYQFFDQQAKQYEASLQQAEAQMVALDNANNISSLEQERALDLQHLTDAQKDESDARAVSQATTAQMAVLYRQEANVPARVRTQESAGSSQESTAALYGQLVNLQNRRTEMLNRFQPTDILVKELDAEIATTKAAIDRISSVHTAQTTEDTNPVHTAIEESLQHNAVEAKAAQAKLAVLAQVEDGYRMRLTHLQEIGLQQDALTRKIQDLKENGAKYMEKRDNSRIDDELDRNKIIDVAIAEAPSFSMQPIKPHRKTNMLLGGVFAIFLPLGLIFVKELGRQTFFRPAELASVSSCPVLATIPDFSVEGSSAKVLGDLKPISRLSSSSFAERQG